MRVHRIVSEDQLSMLLKAAVRSFSASFHGALTSAEQRCTVRTKCIYRLTGAKLPDRAAYFLDY